MHRTLLALLLSAAASPLVAQPSTPVAPHSPPPALGASSGSGPTMSYASYLGGVLTDRAKAVASCPDGGIVFVGTTGSANFPVTPGAVQPTRRGLTDSFVAKLHADGSLAWATFLGATDMSALVPEVAEDVAVAPDGTITVVGLAVGNDFPATPGAAQTQSPGKLNAYAAKFSADGALLWATYLGGSDDDYAMALALDAQGRAVIAGRTFSKNFPVTPGAYDLTENSLNFLFNDAWVARLAADGSAIEWATYVGGLLRDEAEDVALAADGTVYVTGVSGSTDFPATPGAYDASFNGASGSKTDAFLLRLSADGSTLDWATYYGAAEIVEGAALALDDAGRPVIAGRTRADDLPGTTFGFQPDYAGGDSDGFLAGFSSDGAALRFATYVGGSGRDVVLDLALSDGGQPTLVGLTDSPDFPVRRLQLAAARGALSGDGGVGGGLGGGHALPGDPGAFFGETDVAFGGGTDGALGGALDGFVLRTRRAGEALVAASFLGGSGNEESAGLAHDAAGRVLVVGHTNSSDLVVSAGAAESEPQGADDAFVQRLSLPPVIAFAASGLTVGPGAGVGSRADGVAPARLHVDGALEPGTPLRVELEAPSDGRATRLLVGVELAPRAVAGGVLLPAGALRLVDLPRDGGGAARLLTRWPAGVPSGAQLVLQAVTRDAAGWTPGAGALLVAP